MYLYVFIYFPVTVQPTTVLFIYNKVLHWKWIWSYTYHTQISHTGNCVYIFLQLMYPSHRSVIIQLVDLNLVVKRNPDNVD